MRTDSSLRLAVLGSVAQALCRQYGDNYSTRCMQSSSAIVRLLAKRGVDAFIAQGEACFGQVSAKQLAWYEFGGKPGRSHFWVVTEFGELVDLTVNQTHLAPHALSGAAPFPALWRDDCRDMPAVFRYLPAEATFEANSRARFDLILPTVVSSCDDLNRMAKEGDLWASSAWKYGDLPPPTWANRRLDQLAREGL